MPRTFVPSPSQGYVPSYSAAHETDGARQSQAKRRATDARDSSLQPQAKRRAIGASGATPRAPQQSQQQQYFGVAQPPAPGAMTSWTPSGVDVPGHYQSAETLAMPSPAASHPLMGATHFRVPAPLAQGSFLPVDPAPPYPMPPYPMPQYAMPQYATPHSSTTTPTSSAAFDDGLDDLLAGVIPVVDETSVEFGEMLAEVRQVDTRQQPQIDQPAMLPMASMTWGAPLDVPAAPPGSNTLPAVPLMQVLQPTYDLGTMDFHGWLADVPDTSSFAIPQDVGATHLGEPRMSAVNPPARRARASRRATPRSSTTTTITTTTTTTSTATPGDAREPHHRAPAGGTAAPNAKPLTVRECAGSAKAYARRSRAIPAEKIREVEDLIDTASMTLRMIAEKVGISASAVGRIRMDRAHGGRMTWAQLGEVGQKEVAALFEAGLNSEYIIQKTGLRSTALNTFRNEKLNANNAGRTARSYRAADEAVGASKVWNDLSDAEKMTLSERVGQPGLKVIDIMREFGVYHSVVTGLRRAMRLSSPSENMQWFDLQVPMEDGGESVATDFDPAIQQFLDYFNSQEQTNRQEFPGMND